VRALAEGRLLWGFADDGQGFWRDRHVPKDCFCAEYELRERYRCPEPLAAFADHYRSREPTSAPPPVRPSSAPPPAPIAAIDELRIVRLPSASALEDHAAREIQKALAEGLDARDIAVLSLGGQLKTELCARERIGQHQVRRADAPDACEHVVADTFLRFKGLERPLVLVVELDRGKHRYDVRMHVALTRATVRSVVLATKEEIEADARLGAAG
jgi:hypothetical protein